MSAVQGRRVLPVLAAIVLVSGCTGSTDPSSGASSGPSSGASSEVPQDGSASTESAANPTSPAEGVPSESAPTVTITSSPSPQPVVKAVDGPPWMVEGKRKVSAEVAAPEEFAPSAQLDVPAGHAAITVAFQLKNEGKSDYLPGGFSVSTKSSSPCQGFSYLSEGVTGVPEVVSAGTTADFTYGFICEGDTGDRLTLKIALDTDSPTTTIKTTIPD